MKKLSIKEIQEILAGGEVTDAFLQELANDERKGVQKLLKKREKEAQALANLHARLVKMSVYEEQLYENGYEFIAGIDEVGRGPLAGPVVSAAVVLPRNVLLLGLDDSKKMPPTLREQLFEEISATAVAIGIGIVDAKTIDDINIYEATKRAMGLAIADLGLQPDYLLIDAMNLNTGAPETSLIKGDSKSISIAAASVIAKVTRDRMMQKLGAKYPAYGFENHMGYGTKAHLEALEKHGITPAHRKTFAPVKDYVD